MDPSIFVHSYFARCHACGFCHDACCDYGVDVDADNRARIERVAGELEAYTSLTRERWFAGETKPDADYADGLVGRTAVVDGACVFRDRTSRGCVLHRYCHERGLDYHTLKPLVSTLFPLTFDAGVLMPSIEVTTAELICLGPGESLYRGVRDVLALYFGDELVACLDELERGFGPPVALGDDTHHGP